MLTDGDYLIEANGAVQWLGVRGAGLATVPLVVLHGGPGANNWIYEQCVASAIARERTLVLHEQRGCGRAGPPTPGLDYSMKSLVADVEAVIDLLAVERVDLLGWSFGADLATRVALKRPDRVRRLVLQAPALDFTEDRVPEYLMTSYLELSSPDIRDDVSRVVHGPGFPWDRMHQLWSVLDGETADRVGYHQPQKAVRARQLYDEFGIGTNMDMLQALTAQGLEDSVVHRLGEIPHPTLVITGSHDHNVDPSRTRSVARAIRHSRVVEFTASAHMPDLEEPGPYVEALLRFLGN